MVLAEVEIFLKAEAHHGILAPEEAPRGYLASFELTASCPFLRVKMLPELKTFKQEDFIAFCSSLSQY